MHLSSDLVSYNKNSPCALGPRTPAPNSIVMSMSMISSLSKSKSKSKPLSLIHLLLSRPFSTTTISTNPNQLQLQTPAASSSSSSSSRSITPQQSQFQSWTSLLRPGFTPSDLTLALDSLSDPDLALDLFRWSSLTPHFRPSPSSYHSLLRLLLRSRHFSSAESLLHEILSGACPPDLPLFNLLLRFCSSRRHLFSTAFDLFKKLPTPDLDSYTTLLTMLLRRFGKPPVSYIHLRTVRSLARRMKADGVIPDGYLLNILIKAYSKCLEMEEAVRVFREMGLYNCEPNEYSYGYIVKGMCEKGRVGEGLRYYEEMRGKGFVPTSGVFTTLLCALAMEGGSFHEARRVLEDMLGNGFRPDFLTYRTLLEGMCRAGQADQAMELLEELGTRKGPTAMDRRVYQELLEGLHWLTHNS